MAGLAFIVVNVYHVLKCTYQLNYKFAYVSVDIDLYGINEFTRAALSMKVNIENSIGRIKRTKVIEYLSFY